MGSSWGRQRSRIGQLLCGAGIFLAVASVQFCPVKVCSKGTSMIISILGALLSWRREVNRLERFFEIRRKLIEEAQAKGEKPS